MYMYLLLLNFIELAIMKCFEFCPIASKIIAI